MNSTMLQMVDEELREDQQLEADLTAQDELNGMYDDMWPVDDEASAVIYEEHMFPESEDDWLDAQNYDEDSYEAQLREEYEHQEQLDWEVMEEWDDFMSGDSYDDAHREQPTQKEIEIEAAYAQFAEQQAKK